MEIAAPHLEPARFEHGSVSSAIEILSLTDYDVRKSEKRQSGNGFSISKSIDAACGDGTTRLDCVCVLSDAFVVTNDYGLNKKWTEILNCDD
ncbi:unnamed protein product [Acanthoscelides obtectus]|uniref:Uncharacterized protein n=1 Tax=Acanthoscelides obtectus TaxID=200917 RepID=A0A9P0Q840_ACAOB|nr:unnamed protein product [Acanthoscelides obtectus]CAK1660269.1 hypothetical protein AOBTE_LOCUS21950 [Acanthoscelides obtectus]